MCLEESIKSVYEEHEDVNKLIHIYKVYDLYI